MVLSALTDRGLRPELTHTFGLPTNVRGRTSRGLTSMRMADIKPGWTVVGNDGRPVGTIREVGQNYILTSPAWSTRDIYVPASAIANVEHESVHLSVPQPNVAQMGW